MPRRQTRRARYSATYEALYDAPPPPVVRIGRSDAPIFTPGRGFMSAFDYTMQLQVGCPGACLFCYVPAAPRLTAREVRGPDGRSWGFIVRNKINIPRKLRRSLDSGRLADKTVYWSGVTDPYAAEPWMTRRVWEIFLEAPPEVRPRRIAVQSRYRPDRDASLMRDYARSTRPSDGGSAVVVSYSIGTDRNDLIEAWERATPIFEKRLRAIERLRAADLFVVATLSPFGPWRDLPAALVRLRELGVSYVTCLFFKAATSTANTPRRFLEHVKREYPFLLDPAWQREMEATMKEFFGEDRVLVGQRGFASLTKPHRVPGPVSL